jgi:hypothetical protein
MRLVDHCHPTRGGACAAPDLSARHVAHNEVEDGAERDRED